MSTESGEKSKQKVEIKVSRGTGVKDCIYFERVFKTMEQTLAIFEFGLSFFVNA